MEKKELYAAWLKAKKAEAKAKDKRVELEYLILDELPEFEEKSKTIHEDGFKIVVKKSGSYSFTKEWEVARTSIPENLRPEKIKYSVDEKGLNYLKENDIDLYKKASESIVYKTGKTGFVIEKE